MYVFKLNNKYCQRSSAVFRCIRVVVLKGKKKNNNQEFTLFLFTDDQPCCSIINNVCYNRVLRIWDTEMVMGKEQ